MSLSPSQLRVVQTAESSLLPGRIVNLWTKDGLGRSTMLQALHSRRPGVLITLHDFVERHQRASHPNALEESFFALVSEALTKAEVVYVDDLHALDEVVGSCRHFYPRCGFLEPVLTALCAQATASGRTLVLATSGSLPGTVASRAYDHGFEHLDLADYQYLLNAFMGELAPTVEAQQLFRFAARLNVYQLQRMCEFLKQDAEALVSQPFGAPRRAAERVPSTQKAIDYLLKKGFGSNVALSDVECIELSQLKGIDAVVEALETHVVLPFESSAELQALNLRPKKGVLLHGPPGTGKTSIGRALAHRLKGKFFLIDGTFINGTRDFYQKLSGVFESARQNSPAVIFIDDSDVLFEDTSDTGLYRYLLTLLDGLENESEAVICTMMTTMDIASIPRALVRSGRLELWLELKLPDATARDAILESWLSRLPDSLGDIDRAPAVEASGGFTGAELRRVVDDAKHFYGLDRVRGRPTQSMDDYLLRAVSVVRENQKVRAAAEERTTTPVTSGG